MALADSTNITRRTLLLSGGAAVLAACSGESTSSDTTPPPTAASSSTTTVVLPVTTEGAAEPAAVMSLLIPPDSIGNEVVERFATEQGCALLVEVYADNGFVIDRLLNQSDDHQYDLMVVPGAFLPAAISNGLVREIDATLVPGVALQLDSVRLSPFDPDGLYSVCREVGYTGYAWDKQVVPDGVASWDDFLRIAALPEVSGKVTGLQEGAELVAISSWSKGAATGAEFDIIGAEAALREMLVPHLLDLDSGASVRMAEGSVVLAQMWSGEGRRLVRSNPDRWGYAIGGPVTGVWMERFVIPSNAPRTDLAHAFIELMLQPDVSAAEMDRRGYNTGLASLQESIAGLDHGDLIPAGEAMFGDTRDYGESLLAASGTHLTDLVVGVQQELYGTSPVHTTPDTTVPEVPADTTVPVDTTPATEPPPTTVQLDSKGRRVLRPQDTGPEVEQLQHRLVELGFSIGRADGWYGDVTLAAVLAFQRSQGLQTDGVVGSHTWDALENPKPIVSYDPNTRGVPAGSPSDATGHGAVPADSHGRTWVKAVIYLDSFRDEFFDSAGNRVGSFPNSPGVNGLTPTGTFHVYSRSSSTFYSKNPAETMKWMVRFNGGIGFHSVPRINGVPEPTPLGQAPSSHGCIRHADDVAKVIYDNLADGATVVVQHG